jgi:hypothetical protein
MALTTASVDVSYLNNLLVCKICSGYYREAHTISECLHTFCKTCIFKHFNETLRGNVTCPTCQVAIGTTIPGALTKLIYDRNLQSIVDKIFPQFAEEERAEKAKRDVEEAKLAKLNNTFAHDLLMQDDRPAKKTRTEATTSAKQQPPTTTIPQQPASSAVEAKDGGEAAGDYLVKLMPLEDANIPEAKKLPALPKPSFKSDLQVKMSKIQAFVFKRLSPEVQSTVQPTDIDIYYTDRCISSLESLARIAKEIQAANPQFVTLHYRRK